MFEWYDFALFGLLAEPIGAAFFPSTDRNTQFLSAFAVYGSGFLMRQLGGVLFGVIGDRAGRLVALRISIVAMLVPAVGIVVLPPYQVCDGGAHSSDSGANNASLAADGAASLAEGAEDAPCRLVWGVAAPIVLVLLRLLQGVSVGGELVGAITYSLECAGPERRGLLGAFIQIAGSLGGLLATSVVAVVRAASEPRWFLLWGWRIPFAVGLALPLLGLVLRRSLRESPAFLRMRQIRDEAAAAAAAACAVAPPPPAHPLRVLMRHHKGLVLRMIGLSLLWQAGGYLVLVWVPAYLSSLRDPPVTHAFTIHVGVYATYISSMLLSGYAADRLGARRLMLAGACASTVGFPLLLTWLSLAKANDVGVFVAHALLAHLFTWYAAPLTGHLFGMADDVETRFCTLGTATNIASAFFGGTAPILATLLLGVVPGTALGPGLYVAALALPAVALLAFSH